jgi:hypothetical protein
MALERGAGLHPRPKRQLRIATGGLSAGSRRRLVYLSFLTAGLKAPYGGRLDRIPQYSLVYGRVHAEGLVAYLTAAYF